jgi:[acyl-carrier-protein] S-malonyltransferase
VTTSIALLFPGSGSQYKGMMRSLCDESRVVRETLDEADDILGTPLSKIILEGGTAKLNRIGHMLPAICTASVAHYRLYMERVGIPPVFMAGHSLGEYSALICSGALSFRSGLELVRTRSHLAEKIMEKSGGSMSILKNVDPAEVESMCQALKDEGKEIGIACRNSPSQVSVSGADEAVQELERRVTETWAGAQAMHLIGSAPYHCSLMMPAAEEMARELQRYEWQMPECQVISNVTGRPYTSVEEMWEQLPRQLYNPVQWLEGVTFMLQHRVKAFIEMGPQNVLKNIMGDITDQARVYAHDEKVDRAHILASYGSQRSAKSPVEALAENVAEAIAGATVPPVAGAAVSAVPGVAVAAVAGAAGTPAAKDVVAAGADPRLKAISMCLTHAVTTRNHNDAAAPDNVSFQRYEEVKRMKHDLEKADLPMKQEYVEQAFTMLDAMFGAKGTPPAERELRLKQIKDRTGLEPQAVASRSGQEERG